MANGRLNRCESCGRFIARDYSETDTLLCPKCDALIGFLYENEFWLAVKQIQADLSMCGYGFREIHFNFSGSMNRAKEKYLKQALEQDD